VSSRESVGSNIVNSRPISDLYVWELSEKLGPSHLAFAKLSRLPKVLQVLVVRNDCKLLK
jgi:hypothetical protein